jgi:hypothetical protein
VCWQHPGFKEHIQIGSLNKRLCKAFPETLNPCDDKHGHGTHAASVLLQTAPNIELYIARVADDAGVIVKENDYQGVINVRAIWSKQAQSSRQLIGLSLHKST